VGDRELVPAVPPNSDVDTIEQFLRCFAPGRHLACWSQVSVRPEPGVNRRSSSSPGARTIICTIGRADGGSQ
jgi:hypothetical protein